MEADTQAVALELRDQGTTIVLAVCNDITQAEHLSNYLRGDILAVAGAGRHYLASHLGPFVVAGRRGIVSDARATELELVRE